MSYQGRHSLHHWQIQTSRQTSTRKGLLRWRRGSVQERFGSPFVYSICLFKMVNMTSGPSVQQPTHFCSYIRVGSKGYPNTPPQHPTSIRHHTTRPHHATTTCNHNTRPQCVTTTCNLITRLQQTITTQEHNT